MIKQNVKFQEFAVMFGYETQWEQDELKLKLQIVKRNYAPEGFFLMECHMMDSSSLGRRTILPYGGASTCETVPDHPMSPKGLASDMSVVIATMLVEEL